MNVKQFLARQLNDHSESPSGVVQKTFYEWTDGHITDALHLGVCYLYSILPDKFSKLTKIVNPTKTCVVDFCVFCPKFLGIINMEIEGETCITTTKIDSETNSLTSLLSMNCTGSKSDEDNAYLWDIVDGSECVVRFDREVPVGATFNIMCASAPVGIEALDDDRLCEFLPLIADYALWWLFRTDSESRSNLDRAKLHFDSVRDYVTTKLLLEFSLQEDDYNFGRRRVDD